ncbi:B3 domain-containing protein [Drosera capensis]
MEEESSESCMSWQERVYWSHFQTTQFCQILPRDFNHHLVIPKKFAGNMWHKLPTKALLKSPNGATWKVELKGDGDELRFLDGWGEFVKACSLKENDLLIFKYSGNSNFDVLIFNLESLCEKESVYFIRKCGCAKPNSGSQQKRDKWIVIQDRIHDFGSVPSKRSRKYSSQEPIVMEQTNDRVQQNTRTQDNFLSRIDDHDGDMPAAVRNPAVQQNTSNENEELDIQAPLSVQRSAPEDNGSTPSETPLTSAETGCTQRKRSSRKFSSLTRLKGLIAKKSTSKGNKALSIQALTSVQESVLRDDESTPRATPYTPAESSCRQRKRKLVASSSSAKPNNPSAKSSPPKYASNRRAITEEEKAKAIKMAEQEFTDGSFMVIMPPSAVYKKFFMSIPADWVFKHSHHISKVTLRIGTKTWTTRFLTGKGRTRGLCTGWKKFALDNCLEQFDVCMFKPSGNDEQGIILDVSIFRVVPEVESLSLVF